MNIDFTPEELEVITDAIATALRYDEVDDMDTAMEVCDKIEKYTNFVLTFCDDCFQMTNHLDGICQKCLK